MDWLDLLAVQGTQESSPTPQFKTINSLALSFLYSPTTMKNSMDNSMAYPEKRIFLKCIYV